MLFAAVCVVWTAGQDAHSSCCCIATAVAVLRGDVAAAVSAAERSCGLPPITIMIRPAALNLWIPRHRLKPKPGSQPRQYRQDKRKYLEATSLLSCMLPTGSRPRLYICSDLQWAPFMLWHTCMCMCMLHIVHCINKHGY